MARERGSRPLKIRVTCSDLPGCGDFTGSRLHCTAGVDKPVVVQLKIRSSVVSVLISLIVFRVLYLVFLRFPGYQNTRKSVRKFIGQFVFGQLHWFSSYSRHFIGQNLHSWSRIFGPGILFSGLFYFVLLVLFNSFLALEPVL